MAVLDTSFKKNVFVRFVRLPPLTFFLSLDARVKSMKISSRTRKTVSSDIVLKDWMGTKPYRFTESKKFVPDITSPKRPYAYYCHDNVVRQFQRYTNFVRSTDKR